MVKQKFAFLDRDGTIIIEPPRPAGIDPRETFPLKSPDEVVFMEGAISGLKELTDRGYKLVLVTNQTFLGSARHPKEVFDQVMDKMLSVLVSQGIIFDYVMVCPHSPDEGCECRKPKIGGLKEYLKDFEMDLENSYMFGDRSTDAEFAKNLGVKFIKVETNQKFDIKQVKDAR